MSDIGRVPLWMVATVGGLAALGLLTLFFFQIQTGVLNVNQAFFFSQTYMRMEESVVKVLAHQGQT
jgi:hypothetical protein